MNFIAFKIPPKHFYALILYCSKYCMSVYIVFKYLITQQLCIRDTSFLVSASQRVIFCHNQIILLWYMLLSKTQAVSELLLQEMLP